MTNVGRFPLVCAEEALPDYALGKQVLPLPPFSLPLLGSCPIPLVQQEENTSACPSCTLLLSPGAGSVSLQCSARCGTQGTMKREVRCSVEAPLCDESRKPSSEKACSGPPCDRRWTASDWGPVSPEGLLLPPPVLVVQGWQERADRQSHQWSAGFCLAEARESVIICIFASPCCKNADNY